MCNDGKIYMTQKKTMKTVVALQEKKQQHVFDHEDIAYKGNALTLMNIEPSQCLRYCLLHMTDI